MVEITPERKQFAHLVVELGSVAKVAKKMNRNPVTLYHWQQRPEVKAEIKKRQESLFFELSTKLGTTDDNAIQVMTDIMNNEKTNEQTRLQAAMFLIKTRTTLYEDNQLEQRIERLEQLQKRDNAF